MHILSISDRIKEERERLGFSQAAFAGVAEATRNSQLNWEKGTAFPNAVVLAAWAKIGADVLYIVTGERFVDISKTISPEEEVWLGAFRSASKAVRKAALGALLSENEGRIDSKREVYQANIGSGGINIGGDFGSGNKDKE